MNSDPNNNEPDRSRPRHELRKFIQELIDQQGLKLDAEKIISERPELQNYRSLIVDLAYEDFCRRRERGEDVEAAEFSRRFGAAEKSLIAMLEFDGAIRANPEVIPVAPDTPWPRCGETFCKFDLVELLGIGGASRVFLARQHEAGDRFVVLKICRYVSAEANLLGTLTSRGIGEFHTVETDPETGYSGICMPFFSRVTLNDLAEDVLREPSLPDPFGERLKEIVAAYHLEDSLTEATPLVFPDESTVSIIHADNSWPDILCRWGMQMCVSLGDAHRNGTLHCDVKPANLLVLPDLSLRLLDFNLAVGEGKFDGQGGTVQFMSTEQLFLVRRSLIKQNRLKPNNDWHDPTFNCEDVSPASDVFGICATLWYCATGQPPYGFGEGLEQSAQVPAMLNQHLQGIVPDTLAQARFVIPDGLLKVILKGLSPDPAKRYPDTASLLKALTSVAISKRSRRTFMRRSAYLAGACVLGIAAYLGPLEITEKEERNDKFELQIRGHIEDGNFEEAMKLGKQHPNDDRIQFLTAAAQTQEILQVRPLREWTYGVIATLRDCWLAQAGRPVWEKEANYYLALLLLESREYPDALAHYRIAKNRGLSPDPSMEIVVEFLSIEDSREAVDFAKSQLEALPFDGTNGQYCCLMNGAANHLENLKNQGADPKPLQDTLHWLNELRRDKRTPIARVPESVLMIGHKMGVDISGSYPPEPQENAFRNLSDRIKIPEME